MPAHRCCLSVSSWRSVLKFQSVGTSLMENFDLYFTQRRILIFLRCLLDARQPLWIVLVGVVPTLFLPFLEIVVESGGSVSCDTQLNGRTLIRIATALLPSHFFGFWFGCSSAELISRFPFIELTFGRMPILTWRFRASTFQEVLTRRSIEFHRLAFLPLAFLFLDTLLPRVFKDIGTFSFHW